MSKKLFIILGFITAVMSVILAATPFSNLAIAPIIIAFICGLVIIYLSKKQKSKTKTIQYIFLLVIMALSLTLYKGVFSKTEVGNSEEIKERDEENPEHPKEIVEDIEIDEDF